MRFDLHAALAANAKELLRRVERVKSEMLVEEAERERKAAEERRRRDAEWREMNQAERAVDRAVLGQLLPWKKGVV